MRWRTPVVQIFSSSASKETIYFSWRCESRFAGTVENYLTFFKGSPLYYPWQEDCAQRKWGVSLHLATTKWLRSMMSLLLTNLTTKEENDRDNCGSYKSSFFFCTVHSIMWTVKFSKPLGQEISNSLSSFTLNVHTFLKWSKTVAFLSSSVTFYLHSQQWRL